MNLSTVSENLAKDNNIKQIIDEAKKLRIQGASKQDIEKSLETLKLFIEKNKFHKAVALTLTMIACDPNKTISLFRRKGILRASRYDFRSKGLEKLIESIFAIQPNMKKEHFNYLNSVKSLLKAAPNGAKLRNKILDRLACRRNTALKTLLVTVNHIFSLGWRRSLDAHSDQLEFWNAEDLALAYSYILALSKKEQGISRSSWISLDLNLGAPLESIYAGIIIDAAKLNELLEAETLIDGMPYQAKYDNGVIKVSSIDPSFERSIRLGYMQSEIQQEVRIQHILKICQRLPENKTPKTLEEIVTEAYKAGISSLVELVSEPQKRLVLKLPNYSDFLQLLINDNYYAEELPCLAGIEIDNYLTTHSGGNLSVSQKLTVDDISKTQRLFRIINTLYKLKLQEMEDEVQRRQLLISSTIPVMLIDDLKLLITTITSEEKAEEIISLLTLNIGHEYLDIQYNPLIKQGDYLIIPPAIAGFSNLPRNIIVSNNLRPKLLPKTDPMQSAVMQVLLSQGFKARSEFTFNIQGKRETDIFCWKDNVLFVFECKNSFHPCSAHELRTSFEHTEKAEKQLDIRLSWLKTKENQEKLFRALDWKIPTTNQVYSGIITANRLFTSLQKGAHPVRQAHELINVIRSGKIGKGTTESISFWKGDSFSVLDLVEYLEGKSVVGMQLAKLKPHKRSIRLRDTELQFDTYTMDAPIIPPKNHSYNDSQRTSAE